MIYQRLVEEMLAVIRLLVWDVALAEDPIVRFGKAMADAVAAVAGENR